MLGEYDAGRNDEFSRVTRVWTQTRRSATCHRSVGVSVCGGHERSEQFETHSKQKKSV